MDPLPEEAVGVSDRLPAAAVERQAVDLLLVVVRLPAGPPVALLGVEERKVLRADVRVPEEGEPTGA
jgi:hypothetical protein